MFNFQCIANLDEQRDINKGESFDDNHISSKFLIAFEAFLQESRNILKRNNYICCIWFIRACIRFSCSLMFSFLANIVTLSSASSNGTSKIATGYLYGHFQVAHLPVLHWSHQLFRFRADFACANTVGFQLTQENTMIFDISFQFSLAFAN